MTDARGESNGVLRPTSVASIGVVVYRPSAADPSRFDASWYSTTSPHGQAGTGEGRGDISTDVAGTHEITYHHADGSVAGGPFVLDIVARGDTFALTWSTGATAVAFGVGIRHDRDLVATYWVPARTPTM
jgi:hypothetical protein